jgi:putative PIN family toxin of toxin-antitoxin system
VRGPAVIDTNVVVSGILTARRESPTARIVDAMLNGRFRYLISVELLAEYREVLLRPKISRRHGLSPSEVDIILADIAAAGAVVEVEPPPAGSRKGGDDHLWRILAWDGSAVLVTGDRELFDQEDKGRKVLSPREFVEQIQALSS